MRQPDKMGPGLSYPMNALMTDVISILHDKPKGLETLEQPPGDERRTGEAGDITERVSRVNNESIGELQRYLISLLEPAASGGLHEKESLAAASASPVVIAGRQGQATSSKVT